jgi:hypothetical protein
VTNSYVACVKGKSGILPRGYPWALLPWYAIFGALFATVAFKEPSWGGISLGMVLFSSGLAHAWVIWNAKFPVFRADPEGIRLVQGRHRVTVPWEEIQQIRISPRTDGAVADILLLPSAPFVPHRFPRTAQVLLATAVPQSYVFLKSPLLTPLTDPIRYSVPVSGTTADEVAEGLQPLAPDSVPIVNAGSSASG